MMNRTFIAGPVRERGSHRAQRRARGRKPREARASWLLGEEPADPYFGVMATFGRKSSPNARSLARPKAFELLREFAGADTTALPSTYPQSEEDHATHLRLCRRPAAEVFGDAKMTSAARPSHPPLPHSRNRKRQLMFQEQLGEGRQTRKGEISELDAPEPSSGPVSSQWQSRVKSRRKSPLVAHIVSVGRGWL